MLRYRPNDQGGGSAGRPVSMAYLARISFGVGPWMMYHRICSPGQRLALEPDAQSGPPMIRMWCDRRKHHILFSDEYQSACVSQCSHIAVTSICEIKWNVFVSIWRASASILVPEINSLTVLHKWTKSLAQTVHQFADIKSQGYHYSNLACIRHTLSSA